MHYAWSRDLFQGFSWTLEPWRKKGMVTVDRVAQVPDHHCLVVSHFAPWWSPLKEYIAEGRPYIEIDYGYWGPDQPKRTTRRVTYCGHHNVKIKSRPYSRTHLFADPPIGNWRRTPGEYILVPMPVEKLLLQRTGETLSQWCSRMQRAIEPYWSGPIVWRKKIGSQSRFQNFKLQLERAHAVVGERTMSCAEANLLGVPGFTVDLSISTLLTGDLRYLQNFDFPNRDDWWDHVCWSQFTPEEFASTRPADLVELYQM
jgi:hypothetical protein